MPDKEFTIDENTKALTFAEDRLPVVVKYNGNTIEGMSALTKNVNNTDTNTNKVSYTSEYNKSLMSFDVNGSTVQNLPPSQYTLKGYVEMSTGDGAWLNTPLIINSDLKIKYTAKVWTGTTFNGSSVFNIATDKTTLISLNINGNTVVSNIPKNSTGGYTAEIDIPNAKVTINDTVYDISAYLPLSDTTTTFGIGRRSDNAHFTYGVHRISFFEGTDGVNQCDLIPCVDTNGSVSGFYDLCSNSFRTTSGSYKFTSGGTYSLPEPNKPIPIQNANDNGMSVILRGENLFNAQGEIAFGGASRFKYGNNYITNESVTPSAADRVVFLKTYPAGTYTISAKGEYAGDGFTYRFLCTAKYNGGTYNSFYKSYYFDLLKDTLPQNTFTFTTTEDFQIGFAMSGSPAYLRGTIYDIMLTPTSQAVKYKPYVEETIAIPTSISVNGTSAPLLFSEYDKVTVNRVNNEVKYYEGSVIHSLTGNETTFSTVPGNGNNYRVYFSSIGISGSFVYNVGSCSHFVKAMWNPLSKQGTYATRNSDIIFRTDGVETLDDFKAFLQEQYANGTPVTFIIQRQTPIKYDITNTGLGISILDLTSKIPYGTIYLEISSGLTVPITVNYAKWGGADE